MKSDIDNWVAFLNETTSKANINNVSFDMKKMYQRLKDDSCTYAKKNLLEILKEDILQIFYYT